MPSRDVELSLAISSLTSSNSSLNSLLVTLMNTLTNSSLSSLLHNGQSSEVAAIYRNEKICDSMIVNYGSIGNNSTCNQAVVMQHYKVVGCTHDF